MSPPSTSPPVEDVLRKIGRNIVNFQKLEQALRKLLPRANISISLGESRNSSGRSTKSLRKKPLGEIVERFDSAFYGDRATPESDLASAGARLSFSMKLDGGAGSEAHRRELMALVRERNRLVHHDLFDFDFASESSCQKLAERLDAQNQRILAQLEFVRSVRDSHTSALATLAAFVESDEFLMVLGNGNGDA